MRPRRSHLRLPVAALAALPLASCGLIKLPFKVAGAVVEGGAYVGKKAYHASADALTKSDEEKAEAAEKKARKQAEKEAGKPTAKPAEPPAETLPEPAPAAEPELPAPSAY